MSSSLKRSAPLSTRLDIPRLDGPPAEAGSAIGDAAQIGDAALKRFIVLYEKNYGVHLEPGEATVKARKLLSLFRLFADHANRDLQGKAK